MYHKPLQVPSRPTGYRRGFKNNFRASASLGTFRGVAMPAECPNPSHVKLDLALLDALELLTGVDAALVQRERLLGEVLGVLERRWPLSCSILLIGDGFAARGISAGATSCRSRGCASCSQCPYACPCGAYGDYNPCPCPVRFCHQRFCSMARSVVVRRSSLAGVYDVALFREKAESSILGRFLM